MKKNILYLGMILGICVAVGLLFYPDDATESDLQGIGIGSVNSKDPKALKGVGIEEHLGDSIAVNDLHFTDESGAKVPFESYFQDDLPVILILGYYECPKLCSLMLTGFTNSIRSLKSTVGKDFRVITLSIDPKEKADLARAKKKNYVQHYGRREAMQGWHFLTGDEENIQKLSQRVGFKFRYDSEADQFVHTAAITLLSPRKEEAVVTRYLYGINFSHNDLRLALIEAAAGKVGNIVERILLFCYSYDPDSNTYSFTILWLLKVLASFTLFGLGFSLFRLWRQEPRTS